MKTQARKFNIVSKLIILACMAGIVFLWMISHMMGHYFEGLKKQRLNNLKSIVQVARKSIEPTIEKYRSEAITKGEALLKIRDQVRGMTYIDQKRINYIFMSNYDGVMLVQPFERSREMVSQWNLQDEKGVYLIRGLVETAKNNEEGGFFKYHYRRPDSYLTEEKISYVIGIPELQCYIGTGKYMNDIYQSQHFFQLQIIAYTVGLIILIVIIVYFFISNLVSINKQLQKAKEIAESANIAKTQFLTNMSHEFRTPLSLVIGFSEILEGYMRDQKAKDYLFKIRSNIDILLTLINDILDLSELESGDNRLKYTKVVLNEFVCDIEYIFSARIEQKKLRLITELAEGVPNEIVIDRARLRQIMFNLIGNAVKFTDSGYIKLKVIKENKGDSIDLVFSVEDTGVGIDPELKDRIFEAFEKKEEYKMSKYGGLGLGLTIAKRLVEMMGGYITVESEVGKGSIFKVVLKDVKSM